MHSGRKWGIQSNSIAALIVSLATAVSGVARAAAGSATAGGSLIASASRAVDVGLIYNTGSTAGYAAYLSTLLFSAAKTDQRSKGCQWCVWSGGGGARARPTSVAKPFPAFFDFATMTTAPASSNLIDAPDQVYEILATDIAFVGDKTVTPVRSWAPSFPDSRLA